MTNKRKVTVKKVNKTKAQLEKELTQMSSQLRKLKREYDRCNKLYNEKAVEVTDLYTFYEGVLNELKTKRFLTKSRVNSVIRKHRELVYENNN